MMTDKNCYQQPAPPAYGQVGGLGTPTPQQQSPLASVLDALRRKTGALEQLFEAMQSKLSPVLISIPEAPPKETGAGLSAAQSSVTSELSEIEYRLGVLCRKIDLLIMRIDT